MYIFFIPIILCSIKFLFTIFIILELKTSGYFTGDLLIYRDWMFVNIL